VEASGAQENLKCYTTFQIFTWLSRSFKTRRRKQQQRTDNFICFVVVSEPIKGYRSISISAKKPLAINIHLEINKN
jgi:hypothetical protein